jgi:hypothetical protein
MDSERGTRVRLHSPGETEIMQGPHFGGSSVSAALSTPMCKQGKVMSNLVLATATLVANAYPKNVTAALRRLC